MSKKTDLRKHLETLSQDALICLYIQKCFDTDVEKADLEEKLAEVKNSCDYYMKRSNDLVCEIGEYKKHIIFKGKEITKLKQQLADKDKELNDWKDGTIICKWTDAENKVKDLENQLVEKDERIAELEDKDWYEGLIKQLEDQCGRLLEQRDNTKLQLEESEAYIQGNIPKLIEANKMMSKQLAEKEKEIAELNDKLKWKSDWLKIADDMVGRYKKSNQDKISFAVEKLSDVRSFISDATEIKEPDYTKVCNYVDNQIKQLKEGK